MYPFLKKLYCRRCLSGAGVRKTLATVLPHLETETSGAPIIQRFVLLPKRGSSSANIAWLSRCPKARPGLGEPQSSSSRIPCLASTA